MGEYNAFVLGDFNLDQMHDLYTGLFNDIFTCFALTQRLNCSTHNCGVILGLIFRKDLIHQ